MGQEEKYTQNQGQSGTQTTIMPPSQPKKTIRVEVAGRVLSLRTTQATQSVETLADYVNQKWDILDKAAPSSVTMERKLLLLSMNLAEELFELKQAHEELEAHIEERAQAMLNILDEQT